MKAFVINLDSRTDRMESFNHNQFPFPVERFPAIKASCGEDGCTLSHLAILRKYGNDLENYPFVVFEDDCVLIEDWGIVEKAIVQLSYDGFAALWLGANPKGKLERYSENVYRLKKAWCLHAVVYNSYIMVQYILKHHNTPPGKNLDIFYRNNVQERFNCFITYPMVATQLSDRSDIAPCITNNYDELIKTYNKYVNGK